jgi:ATP-grasp domain-containing protein
MKNILVFPCGSEIGLEIYRSLEQLKDFKIYGGSSVKDHGVFVYKNYISSIPFVDKNNFIDKINKIIDKYDIDFIFPAHDSVVLKLSQNRQKIKAKLITSPNKTCEICRSKKRTYDFFKKLIKTPMIFNISKPINKYPVFVKPDIGQGSKGSQIINFKEELIMAINKNSSLVISEYLPGKEYTIDCFTDRKGKLRFKQARERKRILNGISTNSKPVKLPQIDKMAKKINKSLNFRGVWFFQVKESKHNKLTLLEIAPRVAGTMSLCRMQGVNLPLLSLYDQMDLNVEILKNNFKIEVDRSLSSKYETNIKYQNIYIDFDDTLIINNKVNSTLIKYMYQCQNNDNKIILITKHKGNIIKSLEKYNISKKIFNKIIHLKQKQNKYKFIKNNSILIDDSFSERKSVFDKKQIPVFSSNEIECLLK